MVLWLCLRRRKKKNPYLKKKYILKYLLMKRYVVERIKLNNPAGRGGDRVVDEPGSGEAGWLLQH